MIQQLYDALDAAPERNYGQRARADYRDPESGDGFMFEAYRIGSSLRVFAGLWKGGESICYTNSDYHADLLYHLDFVEWKPC